MLNFVEIGTAVLQKMISTFKGFFYHMGHNMRKSTFGQFFEYEFEKQFYSDV